MKKLLLLSLIFLFCVGTIAFAQATLPTSHSGPWKVGPLPSGWTQNGLGNDYSSDYDKSGENAAKFDGSGDTLQINFSGAASAVSYWTKGNSLSGAYTYKIQESVDGSTWTDVVTYNSGNPISGTATQYEQDLLSSSRYLKFLYVNKDNGNVGLDGVTIAGSGVSFIPSGAQSIPVSYTLSLGISITPAGSTMQSWTFLPSNYAGTVSMSADTFNFTPAEADDGNVYTLQVISMNPVSTGSVDVTVTSYVLPDPYICTFEDGSKSGYAADIVELNDKWWNLDGILIGTTEDDKKIGNKSARLKYTPEDGVDAMTVQSKVLANGIGNISMWYGPYGEHGSNAPTLAIEISENLVSGWIEVGQVDAGAVTNLTEYSTDVDVNVPVYVRIRGVGGTEDNSANFDNITITPYQAATGYEAFLLEYNVTPGDPGTATGDDLDDDGWTNQQEFDDYPTNSYNPYDKAIHP